MKNYIRVLTIFLILFCSSCSKNGQIQKITLYALRRDDGAYELLRFKPPYFELESIAHYSVTSFDISNDIMSIVYSSVLYGDEKVVIIPKDRIKQPFFCKFESEIPIVL